MCFWHLMNKCDIFDKLFKGIKKYVLKNNANFQILTWFKHNNLNSTERSKHENLSISMISLFFQDGFCTLNHSILHSGRGQQRFDNGWMWFAGFASFLLLFLFLRFPRSVEPPNFRAAQRFRKLVNLGNGLKSLSLCSVCCLLTKRNQINYLFSFFIFGLRALPSVIFYFFWMKLNCDWNSFFYIFI